MNEFSRLRREARAIRDDSITAAREQYDRTLDAIGDLQASQNRRQRRAGRGVIEQAIPHGREFTQQDVLDSLKVRFPAKNFAKWQVTRVVYHMRRKGLLKRVSKPARKGCSGVYVRIGAGRQPRLVDAVASILADRPLTLIEICVLLLESGWRTKGTRKNLRAKVFRVMRAEPGRFKRQGDAWGCV